MIPPSVINIGGSSTIALSINLKISSNVSRSSYIFLSIPDLAFASIFFISGNLLADDFKEFKSLALALP